MYRKFKTQLSFVMILILTMGLVSGIQPKQAKADAASDFITQLSPVVKTVSKQYNLYPSLMLAQAALESSYGQSYLSTQGNNYFGIKGDYNGQSISLKTAEYDSSGNIYYTYANFKKYPDAQSSLNDYAQLIRNGLVGASNFYSGTWKENSKTVNDAAVSLVGKYATDPNYANKLIAIINQYNLTSLDGGISEQSNTVANNNQSSTSLSTNSSTNSSGSGGPGVSTSPTTTTTTNTSSTNNNSSTTKTESSANSSANSVKVKYYVGDANERVALADNFKKQILYSKIDGSASNVKKYNWKSNLNNGANVYVDHVGYASGGNSSKQTWYRIRYTKSNSAKRYWVKSQALTFPSVKYLKFNTNVDASLISKKVAYDHIYGSSTLANQITDAGIANRLKYRINMIGISGSANNAELWMRYKLDNGGNAWIKIKHVNGLQYLPVSVTKRISAQYSQYTLYNNVPGTSQNQSSISWNTISESTISKVKVDSLAINSYDKIIWAQIKIGNQKYWINNDALY
ncbi:glycoside hydrolase family 73 protein [Lactobacillaceae bacterium Scapto_B20]